MKHVVVEQAFDAPVTPEALLDGRQGAELPVRAFLSSDGMRAVSLYEAVTVEAAKSLAEGTGGGVSHAFASHLIKHDLPEPPAGFSLVVAQRDMSAIPDLSVAMVEHLATDPLGCNDRLRLTHFGAYLGQDLQRMVCVYYSPDVESVRKSNREAQVPWEHLWRGTLVTAR